MNIYERNPNWPNAILAKLKCAQLAKANLGAHWTQLTTVNLGKGQNQIPSPMIFTGDVHTSTGSVNYLLFKSFCGVSVKFSEFIKKTGKTGNSFVITSHVPGNIPEKGGKGIITYNAEIIMQCRRCRTRYLRWSQKPVMSTHHPGSKLGKQVKIPAAALPIFHSSNHAPTTRRNLAKPNAHLGIKPKSRAPLLLNEGAGAF